ncbi:GntR family transcriptional regulator [Bordetella genomosp. 5]|uniref:GntR family transcriptional regulator n=1 Tax=Bordetella genomosp. 5 TaxID=1395608 RepID=A0A261SZE4_9BORD|nr:FCD domain-containing protein [Bordetella genomosp. 5]OZI33420.1 GntR family transcriptional regulator [Bordetella genomosp. 5]OZI42729.1 GntR family transcriptional regulator [Bordetella genomosp. 5]
MLTHSLTLTDRVAGRIAEQIAHGTYAVGAKLPAGRDLAREFGVSAAVIREATERLRAQGLVRSRQGSGCVVLSRTGSQGFRVPAEAGMDRTQLAEVIELRMEVEGGAAALAARRRTDADLAALRGALAELGRHLDDPERGVEHDLAFHRAIGQATHNPSYQQLLQYLNLQLRQAVHTARSNTQRQPGLSALVHQEHEAILAAIEAADEAGAREAVHRHLRNAAARLQLQEAGG